MRNTKQGQIIQAVLQNCDCHPTAEWVYEQVRKQNENVSLGTVYRNLDKLCKTGIIMRINSNGADCYDCNPVPHYHYYCTQCGGMTDVEVEYNDALDQQLRDKGELVHQHRLVFDGICKSCREGKNESEEM